MLTEEFCRKAKLGIHRDVDIAGLIFRVGAKKKSFQLRIERADRKPLNIYLGLWPAVSVAEARANALSKRVDYARGELVTGSKGELTIATAWDDFQHAPRRGSNYDKKPLTIRSYLDCFNRLDPIIRGSVMPDEEPAAGDGKKKKKKPPRGITLRTLSTDPSIMKAETARITKDKGPAASVATIRFVRALYNHAARMLDETLPSKDPCRQCVIRKSTNEQQVLSPAELPAWNAKRLVLPNQIRKHYHLFALLSGARRNDLETMEWKNIDPRERKVTFPSPKGGVERSAFDIPLSLPMIACLNAVKREGRRLYPEQAARWVFPGESKAGHAVEATRDGIASNHALRRTYSSMAEASGVPRTTIDMLIDHHPRDVTGLHYVRRSALGVFLAGQQAAISRGIVAAIKGPKRT